MYTVYKHTTPSGKVYIGITKQNPKKRWQNGNGYKHNTYFYRAILKYGWENIKHEILYEGLTKERACDLEIQLIDKYDATNPSKGYNTSTGGECGSLGVHPSKETREKLRKKATNPSKETRKKMSEARKGKKLPEYWKQHIKEGKSKISLETRKKLSEARKGKKLSEETKRKIGQKTKETHTGMKYKRHKKCTYGCKKIICLDTGHAYESITQASNETGVSISSISQNLTHRSKTAGGYHWKYAD
jgi:group I intron endonuclease